MRDLMSMPETINVGLRFPRSEADKLQTLADRARARELGAEAASLFQSAADATRLGEPVVVVCVELMEAQLLAAGFVRYGIAEPVLEELSG
jgi:hypothetical protein